MNTSSIKSWTMGTLLDFRVPTDIQLSPDGRFVAFGYGLDYKIDKDTPKQNAIYLVDIHSQHMRRFVGDDQTRSVAPRWSPDGTQMAFVSDRASSKESQLFVISFAGGEAEQITDFRGQISNPMWMPDGKALVFETTAIGTEKSPLTPDPVVEDGDPHFNRVWWVDIATRVTRPITPADLNVYEYTLSPNGQWLALVAAPYATNEHWYYAQLYVTETTTLETHQVCTLIHQIGRLGFSPDSQQIAFIAGTLSDKGAVAGDIYTVPRIGGNASNLTPGLDHSPTWLTWQPSGILYGARHVGGTHIGHLDPSSAVVQVLFNTTSAIGNTGAQLFSLAADGQTFATVMGDFGNPLAIHIGRFDQRITHPITDLFATVLDYAVPHVEHYEWQAPDGSSVEGWLQYPNNYEAGKPFPLIVAPHGGPSASYVPHFGVGPWAWRHVLADHGIGAFMPNPRGSWGRGEAYQAANVGDLGGGDWQDIAAGIDLLIARGLVDPDRLGIFGWSYGGYMTTWAITQTKRFKCAVAGAAITNLESNYGVVSIRGWQSVLMGSNVYDQPDQHRARSPLTYVKNVTTPTLLLHGENDVDVPPQQSLEFYTALKHFGVTTQCVIYPREPHGFRERAHQLDMTTRAIDWIEHYLLG